MIKQDGFMALMSAIIISILLLAISLTVSLTGFFSRFNIVDSEFKQRSMTLAEACVDAALLNFAKDPSYNPSNESVTIGSDQCKIIAKIVLGAETTFRTQAIVNKSYTNLQVTVHTVSLAIIRWEEVPHF